jgi:hypothetical protein
VICCQARAHQWRGGDGVEATERDEVAGIVHQDVVGHAAVMAGAWAGELLLADVFMAMRAARAVAAAPRKIQRVGIALAQTADAGTDRVDPAGGLVAER